MAGRGGATWQAASATASSGVAADRTRRKTIMWLIYLEALGAVLLVAFIVWWTMFHGRDR
jgi:hypothetical protein